MKQNYSKLFKLFVVLVFVSFCCGHLHAQNKLGNNPTVVQPGSLLELESLSKGLRLPRITLDDVHVWTLDGSAVSGMLIFNETGAAPKGMYYWNTALAQWVNVVNAADLTAIITGATTVSNTLTGNKLSTTVNGVTGIGVDIIKNNELTIVNGVLTSIVNGVASSPGLQILATADNGLTATNGKVQLGGALTAPTTLTASSVNTLSLQGIQTGDASTDSLLVIVPGTGVIRKLSAAGQSLTMYKSIAFASANGQKQFPTPTTITDLKKIQVYRNGINVEFIGAAGSGTIDLEDPASCYVDDEIKIIQSK
jgi:hypothetical protein